MAKKHIKGFRYGGLLGCPPRIDRPNSVLVALSWRDSENSDLKPFSSQAFSLLQKYIKEQEDTHLESIAIARGIVKVSPFGGMFKQYNWHSSWQHDLLVSLAAEKYPEFGGGHRKRGPKEKRVDYDLLEAILQKKGGRRHSTKRAVELLTKDKNSPWYRSSPTALLKRFNRAFEKIAQPSILEASLARFNAYCRSKLGLPTNSEEN